MDEVQRKYLIKKIKNPADPDQFVLVPMIKEITFIDRKASSQEFVYGFDNSTKNTTRSVHKQTITGMNGSTLNVERIDKLAINDVKTQNQDFVFSLNNKDTNPGPHSKTHIRYWTDPPEAAMPDPTIYPSNADSWIKVEMIDQLDIIDPKTYGQEYSYILQNPTDGSDVPNDIDVQNTTDEIDPVEGVDPPWRFDPFQNVLDVDWLNQDLVFLCGGPNNDGKTLCFMKVKKDANDDQSDKKPRIFFSTAPYGSLDINDFTKISDPDYSGEVSLPGVIGVVIGAYFAGDDVDYWGNIAIQANILNPTDEAFYFYDKDGNKRTDVDPDKGLPKIPDGFDKRGIVIFSDADGIVFANSETIQKWTPGPIEDSTVIWDLGFSTEANTIDPDTGHIILNDSGSIYEVDGSDGTIVNRTNLPFVFDATGGFDPGETYTETRKSVADVSSDCGYVVVGSSSTRINGQYAVTNPSPFGLTPPIFGDINSSSSSYVEKYDRKGNKLWRVDLPNINRLFTAPAVTLQTENSPPVGGRGPDIQSPGSSPFAAGNPGSVSSDISTSTNFFANLNTGTVVCIGKFTLIAYENIGFYGTKDDTKFVGYQINSLTIEDTYINYYNRGETNYFIDIIDDNGSIVDTINWGGAVGGAGSGQGTYSEPTISFSKTDDVRLTPFQTAVLDVLGGASYFNGNLGAMIRKPRYPDPGV